MTGGALGARFEQHQRTHLLGRGGLPFQQMQVEWKAEARQSGQEPGSQKSHLVAASAQREIFAQRSIQWAIGHE